MYSVYTDSVYDSFKSELQFQVGAIFAEEKQRIFNADAHQAKWNIRHY